MDRPRPEEAAVQGLRMWPEFRIRTVRSLFRIGTRHPTCNFSKGIIRGIIFPDAIGNQGSVRILLYPILPWRYQIS